MRSRRREFERLRGVLSEADEPLTAREILSHLDDETFESPHRVATVLGRHADRGDVEVVRDSPYRYRLNT
jgi:predicted Zn-ribbon and HTH transcriptional regulator